MIEEVYTHMEVKQMSLQPHYAIIICRLILVANINDFMPIFSIFVAAIVMMAQGFVSYISYTLLNVIALYVACIIRLEFLILILVSISAAAYYVILKLFQKFRRQHRNDTQED